MPVPAFPFHHVSMNQTVFDDTGSARVAEVKFDMKFSTGDQLSLQATDKTAS